jgi:hypothetical protein
MFHGPRILDHFDILTIGGDQFKYYLSCALKNVYMWARASVNQFPPLDASQEVSLRRFRAKQIRVLHATVFDTGHSTADAISDKA